MKKFMHISLFSLMVVSAIAYADLTGGAGVNEDGGVVAIGALTKSLDPEGDAAFAMSIRATLNPNSRGPSGFSATQVINPNEANLPYDDEALAVVLGNCVPGYYIAGGYHGYVDWSLEYHQLWSSFSQTSMG